MRRWAVAAALVAIHARVGNAQTGEIDTLNTTISIVKEGGFDKTFARALTELGGAGFVTVYASSPYVIHVQPVNDPRQTIRISISGLDGRATIRLTSVMFHSGISRGANDRVRDETEVVYRNSKDGLWWQVLERAAAAIRAQDER